MVKALDWDKAARIIKENCYQNVDAGLGEDWFWTGGHILANGEIVDPRRSWCWVASSWATPVIRVYFGDDDDRYIEHECFKEFEGNCAPEEYWPESARNIIEEKEEI